MKKNSRGTILLSIAISMGILVAMCIPFAIDYFKYSAYLERSANPIYGFFLLEEYRNTPARGSDDMVDFVYDAAEKNLERYTSKSREKMVWYIYQNKDDFAEDDFIMENLMYVGVVLEKSSTNEIASDLGYQIYAAVKDVYRGYEPLDSDYVVGKLSRVDKYIETLRKDVYDF